MTHARIRAAQGDTSGARKILRAILERQPGHSEALALLGELSRRRGAARGEEADEALPERQPSDPRKLAARFRRALGRSATPDAGRRVKRLEAWLANISREDDED